MRNFVRACKAEQIGCPLLGHQPHSFLYPLIFGIWYTAVTHWLCRRVRHSRPVLVFTSYPHATLSEVCMLLSALGLESLCSCLQDLLHKSSLPLLKGFLPLVLTPQVCAKSILVIDQRSLQDVQGFLPALSFSMRLPPCLVGVERACASI